jgi:hypothetical protein
MANFIGGGAPVVTTEQLTLTGKIIPQPSPFIDVAATTEFSLTIPVSPVENGRVFEQISESFEVSPGAIVYLELGRTPSNATY